MRLKSLLGVLALLVCAPLAALDFTPHGTQPGLNVSLAEVEVCTDCHRSLDPANAAFAPSEQALAEARAIHDAFAKPENAGKGVIGLNGKMVERLHFAQAEKLLAKAAALGA